MQNIYQDGTYLANNPTWHEEDSEWKARQIVKIINKNNLKPETICEVGCGTGEILNQLSTQLSQEVKFYGYEISNQAFKVCQTKSKSNLAFFLGDLFEKEEHYDIVMAIDVVEHVEDYIGFVKKLRSRGTFKIFHIPLDLSVLAILRNYPMLRRRSVGHLHYFTKETALAMLEDAGYEIVDYFYTKGSIELPNQGGLKGNLLKTTQRVFSSINEDVAAKTLGGFSLLVLAK